MEKYITSTTAANIFSLERQTANVQFILLCVTYVIEDANVPQFYNTAILSSPGKGIVI